jgi:ABC-2 type transport system permease protein
MQVYKCFLKIVRQNMFLIVMYLAIFIVLVVALSTVGQDQEVKNFSDTKVNLAVIDNDGSETSTVLVGLLGERHTLVNLENDNQTLQDALYNRDVEYILFIPEGYEQALVSQETPPKLENAQVPNSYTGAYVDNLVEQFVSTEQVYIDAGFDVQDAISSTLSDMEIQADVTMTHVESQAAPNVYYFYKYFCYSIMLMLIFGLCPVLMVFGKRDLKMRMESSALTQTKKNTQLILGMATFSAVCFAVIIAIGFIMYGVDMFSAGALVCFVNALCFLGVSAAMAYLIGQLASSPNLLSALANVVVMAMCFLGGVFVPLEFMGETMQNIARFLPTYWYVNVTDMTIGKSTFTSQAMTEIAESMGIQILFAVAFLAAALVVSRQRKKEA